MATKKTKVETPSGKFFWNDSEVDEMTFNKLTNEHRLWVEEEARKVIAAAQEEKPKRKKK